MNGWDMPSPFLVFVLIQSIRFSFCCLCIKWEKNDIRFLHCILNQAAKLQHVVLSLQSPQIVCPCHFPCRVVTGSLESYNWYHQIFFFSSHTRKQFLNHIVLDSELICTDYEIAQATEIIFHWNIILYVSVCWLLSLMSRPSPSKL